MPDTAARIGPCPPRSHPVSGDPYKMTLVQALAVNNRRSRLGLSTLWQPWGLELLEQSQSLLLACGGFCNYLWQLRKVPGDQWLLVVLGSNKSARLNSSLLCLLQQAHLTAPRGSDRILSSWPRQGRRVGFISCRCHSSMDLEQPANFTLHSLCDWSGVPLISMRTKA